MPAISSTLARAVCASVGSDESITDADMGSGRAEDVALASSSGIGAGGVGLGEDDGEGAMMISVDGLFAKAEACRWTAV